MLKVYSLFDKKAESFSQPFFTQSHAHATRMVSTLVNDGKSVPAQYPDDFALLYLCDFNEETGLFSSGPTSGTTLGAHEKIVDLSSLKKEVPHGPSNQD